MDRFLVWAVEQAPLAVSVGLSQVISNVPTAVLLAGFTDNGKALLVGTNLGGLGTPVASLASLISLKLYLRSQGADPRHYLKVFLGANAAGLALLLVLCQLMGGV